MIVAATGHRPDKLGGYGEAVRDRLIDGAMRYMEQEKPDEVISGMALGWDQAWAIAAIRLGIPLICALPFEGQFSKWPQESQYWWGEIVGRAARVQQRDAVAGHAAVELDRRHEPAREPDVALIDAGARIATRHHDLRVAVGRCVRGDLHVPATVGHGRHDG